jgi:hypothetical protein
MKNSKEDRYLHEEMMEHRPPDGKTQWSLAGRQLSDLVYYKEEGDDESKRLAEWELRKRYAPCVHGKDDEIQMSPHYRYSPQWIVDTDHGFRYRECVTYEDPESPNPEWYDYDDRISSWYEEAAKKEAYKIACEGAKPSTARWWEIYLSTLTNKKIRVNRIMTGIRNSGYPWNVIGQSEIKDSPTEKTRGEIEATLDNPKQKNQK